MAQYTPKTWTTGETITAAELNAIEAAAAAAAVKADADAAYDAKGAATAAEAAAVAAAATDATTKANAAQAVAVQRANHTGTQSADTLTDGTTNMAYTAAEKTKLAGVATGATANSADAQLRDRSTHTGTQAASTITGLSTVATSGAYSDLSAKPTIPTVGAAGAGAAVALSSTDASVTNSRTPTAHTHPASDLTATGTASATTFLRGDNTWATPAAGGGGTASYPNNSGSATVVARPMFIDVRDYGAAFDGVSNDTAAIQAALDAAVIPATGVTNANDLRASIVQLPPGVAKLSGALQIPANCWLRGHGPSATYLSQSSTTSDTLNNKPSTVQVTISDLGILGPGSPTAGAGIDLSNTGGASALGDSRNIVRDVVIIEPYIGLHNIGGSEGRIERVTVQRPVNIGIQPLATDYFMSDCTVGQPGNAGFMLDGANGRIWGCKVFGGGGDKAFRVSGSGRHEISTCEVQDYNGDAYYIEAGNCILSACASDSNSGFGFNLDAGVNITSVSGGMVYNRGGAYNHQGGVRAFFVVGSHIDVIVGSGIAEFLTDGSGTRSYVNISNERGPQNVAYASTIAPNPFAGGSVYVGTLAGAIAIDGPGVLPNTPSERFHPGQRFAFLLSQDSTGGRTVTFDSSFKTSAAALPTTANSTTRIEFEWTGSVWFEISRTTI